MKLTVIGFRGAYPGFNQAASSYLVEEGSEALLLDCGSGSLSKFPAYRKRHELNGIVISHYHADHFSDLGCFQHAALVETSLELRSRILTIFGPEDPEHSGSLDYRDVCQGHSYNENSKIAFGPFTLTFSANIHPCPSYAIRVEAGGKSLVYTGDTQWYDSLPDFCRHADVLIAETSLYNQFYGKVEGHLTAGETGRLAALAGCGTLILTHLPHYGDHAELLAQAKKAAGEKDPNHSISISLACEGLSWEEP